MKVVGIRELKNHLSRYVRAVRGGETVLVTDRGHVVAELRPADPASGAELPPRLAELVRNGAVRPPSSEQAPELYPRMPTRAAAGAARRLLDAERSER